MEFTTFTRLQKISGAITTHLKKKLIFSGTTTTPVMTKGCNSNPLSIGEFLRSPSSFHLACKIWFIPSDEKIARELHVLPCQEREKVWADLSGNEKASSFRQQVDEDNTCISTSLDALSLEINCIQNKKAFLLAALESQDRSFHVMFLRCCNFDGKKAAKLVFDHLEQKRQLFGDASLGRDITADDLSKSELDMVCSGGLEILQDRDAAGRPVLLSNFSRLQFKERKSLVSARGPRLNCFHDGKLSSFVSALESRELFSMS